MDSGDQERVMAAASNVGGGDCARAQAWYVDERLAAFGGKTPQQLVADGRLADVLRYLESIAEGPAG
jgi:hypothetical protein